MNSSIHLSLLEPHHHHEVLNTFAQLALAAGYQLSIFTQASVKDHCIGLKDKTVDWYIQRKDQSFRELLEEEHVVLNRADLHLFVTLLPSEDWITELPWSAPKILVVHNGYTFLDMRGHLAPTLGGYLRAARAWWQGTRAKLQRLLAFADYISFPDEGIKQHLEESYPKQCGRLNLIEPLPFGLYEPDICKTYSNKINSEGERQNSITITVPGTVTTNNRDYGLLLKVFKYIVPCLSVSVRLVFLGKISGSDAKQICQRMKQLETDYFQFLFFNEPVPQLIFNQWLCDSDFLILPIRPYFDFGPVREYYGLSNTTGTVNDIIRLGKPAILSVLYPLPEKLLPMVEQYKDEKNLGTILLKWVKERRFEERQVLARECCQEYSAVVLLPGFEQTIRNVISNYR